MRQVIYQNGPSLLYQPRQSIMLCTAGCGAGLNSNIATLTASNTSRRMCICSTSSLFHVFQAWCRYFLTKRTLIDTFWQRSSVQTVASKLFVSRSEKYVVPRLHKELNVLAKLFSQSVRAKPVLGFATVSHSWSCLRVRLSVLCKHSEREHLFSL